MSKGDFLKSFTAQTSLLVKLKIWLACPGGVGWLAKIPLAKERIPAAEKK